MFEPAFQRVRSNPDRSYRKAKLAWLTFMQPTLCWNGYPQINLDVVWLWAKFTTIISPAGRFQSPARWLEPSFDVWL